MDACRMHAKTPREDSGRMSHFCAQIQRMRMRVRQAQGNVRGRKRDATFGPRGEKWAQESHAGGILQRGDGAPRAPMRVCRASVAMSRARATRANSSAMRVFRRKKNTRVFRPFYIFPTQNETMCKTNSRISQRSPPLGRRLVSIKKRKGGKIVNMHVSAHSTRDVGHSKTIKSMSKQQKIGFLLTTEGGKEGACCCVCCLARAHQSD